jgi:tRNA(Ile)-lysidine synthase
MAGILRDEDDFLTGHCSSLYEAYAVSGPGQIRMDLKKFKACHPALQRRLVRMAVADLRGNLVNVGSSHIEAVIRLASRSATGARTLIPADSLSGREIWAELSYDFLVFRKADDKQPASAFDCLLPVPGQVRLEELNLTVTAEKWDQNKGLPFSPRCIYIDGEKIKGELRLRQRRDGDRFRPLGMQGRKKLKDYFIDRKIPREQRNRIPLLTDGENIIWVVGFHMSQDYRITERTRRIVKISLQYHADGG